jgi:carbon monoxide dehydrogenase subunit G
VKLEHTFDVAAPVETVWELLLDLERVAPCLPGGEVTEKVDDRNYKANVKVKLGPMQMSYRGDIKIAEVDEAGRRAVMEAKANESRGQGTARATITTTLAAQQGGGTRGEVVTDLQLTGRVAQMGRGIVEDVSNRLMGQFADCLSQRAAAEAAPAAAAPLGAEAPAPTPRAEARPIGGLSLVLGVLLARLRRLLRRARSNAA